MEEKLKQQLTTRLNSIASNSKIKDIWCIEYNNTRLSFSSGKSSWPSIGAAKNALRNAVYGIGNHRERFPVLKQMEDEGIIKYIKL